MALCAVDFAAQGELAPEDELLSEERAFLAAVILASANVIAAVANDRIGRETDLTGLLVGALYVPLSLRERRVCLVCEGEELLQGDRITFHDVAK